MLEFNKLQLGDIDRVRTYFPFSVNKTCDNTVGGAFMWRDYFSVEFAEYNETIIFKAKVKYYNNLTAFPIPLGKDVYGCIEKIVDYCRLAEIPVAFCTVTTDDIEVLRTIFKNYRLFKEADWSDYLYRTVDLTTLPGRKYSGQRNHINNFKKEYKDYVFEEITDENICDVRVFFASLSSKLDYISETSIEERDKTIEVLNNYEAYGMPGGLLRVNGSVAAFSIGEVLRNILYVHVEKADLRYKGVFQVINNEFARFFSSDGIEFINREEDVGDEGLRISKNSYHPCEIIEKYIFVVQ